MQYKQLVSNTQEIKPLQPHFNSQNILVKRSTQWLEIMELICQILNDSSDNGQEEEEKKVKFRWYLEIIGSEEENGPTTKDILTYNKTSKEMIKCLQLCLWISI